MKRTGTQNKIGNQLKFPTKLHQEIASLITNYFRVISSVDTILVVNSCARGQAVPGSDIDFAILIKPATTLGELTTIENSWQTYSQTHPLFLKYKQSNKFAQLHLDLIEGNYKPGSMDNGEPVDNFEIEIGNQICYSAPMEKAGIFFKELQDKWLPYYDEELRLQRLSMAIDACEYDLDHIPFFVKRQLYFHAFDILYKAFQKYLQTLFITNRTYPIAYNKWIKEQITGLLNMPGLYQQLSPILSVSNIESNELVSKAKTLRELLDNLNK